MARSLPEIPIKTSGRSSRPAKRANATHPRRDGIDRPRLVRQRSAISGWGVYAAHTIEEDTRIVEYKGELVTQAEGWRREQRYLPRQRIWIFTIDDRWARDAAFGGNIARYVNHACRPNCYVDIEGRHIWIRASRGIRT